MLKALFIFHLDEGDIVLSNEQGWNYLLELSTVKETDIRRNAIWTVAILAACPGIISFFLSISTLPI